MVTVCLWYVLQKIRLNSSIALGFVCGMGGLSVYIVDAFALGSALSNASSVAMIFLGILVGFAPVQIPCLYLRIVSVKIVQLLNRRRKDLLPLHLSTMQQSSIPASALAMVVLLLGLSGCGYQGIDGTVFGATAEQAGNPPTDSIIDLVKEKWDWRCQSDSIWLWVRCRSELAPFVFRS